MNNDAYEQDREDMAVNERWAEDHGYSRGRCKVHGTFWTDSGDGCPSCTPEPEEMDEELDKLEEAEDALQVALATYHYNLDPINRAAARYAQGESFINALKDEGAL